MYLSLKTLASTIRTGSPILVELTDLEIVTVLFTISNNLTQVVNFPSHISEFDIHSPTVLVLFFFLTLVSVIQWHSLHWEILVLLSQLPLTFLHTQMGIALFIAQLGYF